MTEWRGRLGAATVLRDEGVLVGYCSPQHRQRWLDPAGAGLELDEQVDPLAPPSLDDVPDAIRPVTEEYRREASPDPESLTLERVASTEFDVGWDPLARELHADGLMSAALSERAPRGVRAFAESVVKAHETTHAAVGRRYSSIYEYGYLGELLATIRILCDLLYGRGFGASMRFHGTAIGSSHVRIVATELTQEFAALRQQRSYLDRRADAPDPADAPLPELADAVDDAITEDRPTDELAANPEHAVADWLRRRLSAWELDLLDYAFAFETESSFVSPDVVLSVAAAVDPERVASTPVADQPRLLADAVAAYRDRADDRLPNRLVGVDPDGVSLPSLDREGRMDELRTYRCEVATDNRACAEIPLVARCYPGQPRGRTLGALLWSSYVTEVGGVRRLLLPPGYEWARGTRLLELAVDIHRLHDKLATLPVRTKRHRSGYDAAVLFDRIEAIADGASPGELGNTPLTATTDESIIHPQDVVDAGLGWLRARRGSYETVYEDCHRLGTAILNGDERTVAEFL
jgi:hypothetical protein